MHDLIPFRVRPGYQSADLLVEICGNHRDEDFPKVDDIVRIALGAVTHSHSGLDEAHLALASGRFFSYWTYANGSYEVDDDIWCLFLSALNNNAQVTADIAAALLASGLFVKEEVDFAAYA